MSTGTNATSHVGQCFLVATNARRNADNAPGGSILTMGYRLLLQTMAHVRLPAEENSPTVSTVAVCLVMVVTPVNRAISPARLFAHIRVAGRNAQRPVPRALKNVGGRASTEEFVVRCHALLLAILTHVPNAATSSLRVLTNAPLSAEKNAHQKNTAKNAEVTKYWAERST